jgi:hypothetical protein
MGDSASKTIRNCHFRYRCHMEWEDLDESGDPTIRHCQICAKDVFLCVSEGELSRSILLNRCVAIPREVVGRFSFEKESDLANPYEKYSTILGGPMF